MIAIVEMMMKEDFRSFPTGDFLYGISIYLCVCVFANGQNLMSEMRPPTAFEMNYH